jgi:hypothetical protein
VGGKEVKRVGEKGILWGFGRGKTKERVEIERKIEWEGGAEERKMWMAWRGRGILHSWYLAMHRKISRQRGNHPVHIYTLQNWLIMYCTVT